MNRDPAAIAVHDVGRVIRETIQASHANLIIVKESHGFLSENKGGERRSEGRRSARRG